MTSEPQLREKAINTIRFLAADAVQKANSGHPGLPMGTAAIAYTIWTRHLRYNPQNPHWFNRDRFVLTEGEIGDELFETVRSRLGRPATDRVVAEVEAPIYEMDVKHLHTFGGCEGRLLFTQTGVFYKTAHAKDAREWRMDSDVESVWSQGRYQLEIHVYENNRREFSATRVYQFALKQPLNNEFYSNLKRRLYGLTLAGDTNH
jgi:hypothetical protein